MQWLTIFNKECLEAWRSFKWMWVPLVFILLAIIDPLSTYYLPQILESTGGLPEGATIDIPTPPPSEVFMMSISQLNMLGILIIALISMGTIAGERKSGVAELILVKPVSHGLYVTAKWAAYLAVIFVSVLISLTASWYYVNLLFGDVSLASLLQTVLFYSLWLALVIAISLFMNTLSKAPGMVLFMTISTIIILSVGTNILSHLLEWSPAMISSHISNSLVTGDIPGALWGASGVTIAAIVFLLISASLTLKHKEVA